jgi:sigma-B regulation protein RsbU (phosphoserine phosphatase)
MDLSVDGDLLYEGAACGLLLTTADGTILRANRTFCSWIGHPPEELTGRRLDTLLTIGGRIFHQTHWAPLLKMQRSLSEVKLEMRHADGRRIPMVMNAVVRTHGGAELHELAVFSARDRHKYEEELLKARRRAEELLRNEQRSQQALAEARTLAEDRALLAEQTLGIVGHDLRNPLAAIQMAAEVLGRRELDAERQAVLGDRIRSSTRRAFRLIDDLLDFTRARTGRTLGVTKAEIDAHDIAREVVAEIAAAHPARRLEHQRAGDGRLIADGDRLAQALGNLVSNALTYGLQEADVTVRSEGLPGSVRLSVHNLGPAIDPALRPTLFEPMTRGEAPGHLRSVGLGLYIVREIAIAHGGSVEFRSAEGLGTTFVIELPRALPPA